MANVLERSPHVRRSPERQALAQAIERHREAAEALAHVEQARKQNDERRRAAFWVVENFGAVLEQAKADAAEHLIGGGDPPRSIKEVRADRQDAEDTMETCKLTAAALDKKARLADMSVVLARSRVDEATSKVIASSPAVIALFDEYAALGRRRSGLRQLLGIFGAAPEGHKNWDATSNETVDAGAEIAAWKAWVAALRSDPDAA